MLTSATGPAMTASEPSVVIIGAGPAGCLLALQLAAQHAQVSLYDNRPDIREPVLHCNTRQRSINLAISTRGLSALRRVALDAEVARLAVAMPGRCVHKLAAPREFHPYGLPHQHLLSVSRSRLTATLLDACEKHPCIKLNFLHTCVTVDLAKPSATFALSDGKNVTVSATLIVGADGTFSRVRAAMLRERHFDFSQEYIETSYKELSFQLPSADVDFPHKALHIWPRHDFMLIALPNDRLNFTATLFMKDDAFDELSDKKAVRDFFERNFSDALPFMKDVEEDFFNNPVAPLLTVRCNPFNFRDKAVLIGDAAHAIVPFYGQGCNAALEDCGLLADAIASHGWHQIAAALSSYAQERKPHADTIADLAIEHYHDMSSRSASVWHRLKRRIEITLNALFPNTFLPLYTMVSFSNIPYATAVRRAEKQDRLIASGLVTAFSVSLGAGVCLAASRYISTLRKQ